MSRRRQRAARRHRAKQKPLVAWSPPPREIPEMGLPILAAPGDYGDISFWRRLERMEQPDRFGKWSDRPVGYQKPGHDPSSPINRDARVAGRDWRPRDEQEAAYYRLQHGPEYAMLKGGVYWGKALDWEDKEAHLGYQSRED